MATKKHRYEKSRVQNLFRYTGTGIYFARASFGGRRVMQSLHTDKISVAQIRLAEWLKLHRAAAPARKRGLSMDTWGEAVHLWISRRRNDVALKERTVAYYEQVAAYLKESLGPETPLTAIDEPRVFAWFRSTVDRFSPQRACNILAAAKKAAEEGVRTGAWHESPFQHVRRPRIRRTEKWVPNPEDLEAIVEAIRSTVAAHVSESADFVEFLAWSGCRISEAARIQWEDIDSQWLTVHGSKNDLVRRVPINGQLRSVIERRRYDGAAGPLWTIQSPRKALRSACERLGLPRLTQHGLRHFFATHCIESGVDVPTVALWLGHQDGGSLLLRTYTHLRDRHSLEQTEKLRPRLRVVPEAEGAG